MKSEAVLMYFPTSIKLSFRVTQLLLHASKHTKLEALNFSF